MRVNKRLYNDVKRLYGKESDQTIATQLGVTRGVIQRNCRIVDLSKEIPAIEVSYLNGSLNDVQLGTLVAAFRRGKLRQEWELMTLGRVPSEYYSYRGIIEVREAMQATTDMRVRETLEWVLNLRETL